MTAFAYVGKVHMTAFMYENDINLLKELTNRSGCTSSAHGPTRDRSDRSGRALTRKLHDLRPRGRFDDG